LHLIKYFIMKKIIFLLLVFVFSISYSQTEEQKQQISSNYDIEKLNQLASESSIRYQKDKNEALRLATINNWPVKYEKDGASFELQKISDKGQPIYYMTHNAAAAKSTRANHLHNGGTLGLNLEGQNMTAFVWDAGIARATHQEYDGIGGTDRFSAGDGSGLHDHSAHVMGTIIASGVIAQAKGMAPQADGVGYDWNNDESEAALEAANGMLISNHSYGYNINDLDDWVFGAYTNETRRWDVIFYNAPNYLHVTSAGNDGLNNSGNGDPLDGNSAYDKLSSMTTCKNNLTIANANDANVASDGTLISVVINSGSSEGPTDDLRIKPDITGNGTNLYSTLHASNSHYGSYTGTSMSAPNIAGSLLLLQQYYNDLYPTFMRASTLKGLTLHTADDGGPNGPDAVWGWGLMNSKAAAEAISNNGIESIVVEESLNNGESFSITVQSDNTNPLLASISWTDVPGPANTGVSNDPTPVLVNDLDLRVSNGTEFRPWKLTSVTTNDKGDNIVDPFERVDVTGASGMYTITVTHKGNLTNDTQDFALVVTGIVSEFTFNPIDYVVEQCAPNNAEFDLNYETATGSSSDTTFSAQNIPSGASISFSPNPVNSDGIVTMTVSGLTNVTPGEYIIDISAQNATETETKSVTLIVYSPNFVQINSMSPPNNSINMPFSFDLSWSDDFNSQTYEIQIAEDTNFTNIVQTAVVESSNYSAFNLEDNMTFYWRVKPINQCGSGSYSVVKQFSTANCISHSYSGAPLAIPDSGPDSLETSFNVTDNFLVKDVNVYVEVLHDKISTLLFTLISPDGTNVYLETPNIYCEDAQNMKVGFNDADEFEMDCDQEESSYGYYGNFKPEFALSGFDDIVSVGNWTLDVRDLETGVTGTLISWSLNICDFNYVGASIDDLEFDSLKLWPNPTKGTINVSFNQETSNTVDIALYDVSGRLISSKVFNNTPLNFNENVDFGKLSEGLYIVKITNGNNLSTRKLIVDNN